MRLNKWRIGLILAGTGALGATLIPRYWEAQIEPAPILTPAISAPPQTQVVEDTIQKNRTLVATLVDYDVPIAIANEVADLIKPVFDVRHLRFGNAFRLEKEIDGSLRKFEYKIDDERVLKVEKSKVDPSFEARVEKVDLESRENVIDAT